MLVTAASTLARKAQAAVKSGLLLKTQAKSGFQDNGFCAKTHGVNQRVETALAQQKNEPAVRRRNPGQDRAVFKYLRIIVPGSTRQQRGAEQH